MQKNFYELLKGKESTYMILSTKMLLITRRPKPAIITACRGRPKSSERWDTLVLPTNKHNRIQTT